MTSFPIIETAAKMGIITYKEIVVQLCETDPVLADKIYKQVSPPEDDPKVLRKKFRADQIAKFGKEDKDAVKDALKKYDAEHKSSDPKPRRLPPIRIWTDDVKAYTREKNAYVRSKMDELGDDITLAEQKIKKKEFIAEFARKKEALPEIASSRVSTPLTPILQPVVAPVVAPVAPVAPVEFTDADKKEWSRLKKKKQRSTLDVSEQALYDELKKKKDGK
jgi:hypothetical protein